MRKAELQIKKFWQPDDNYVCHRIPGIFVTSRSTVIVYNEARQTFSDWAKMDIFLQRSEDCGVTFGEPIFIDRGTEEHRTVNNPVMLEDKNGRLHMLWCRDYTVRSGGAWHRFSDDDGLTWSEPEEISANFAPEFHNAFAFGPGHGICLANGTLLVPVWMVPKSAGAEEEAHHPSVLATVYSCDNGATWQLGEILPEAACAPDPNETVAAQLADGRVFLNIRVVAHRRCRAYSPTGYDQWTVPEAMEEMKDPICFGSVVYLKEKQALLAVNCDCENERKNITVKMSCDNGATWPVVRTIDAQRGGYSDIAADEKNERIYVLYEDKFGGAVYLARFTPAWLED